MDYLHQAKNGDVIKIRAHRGGLAESMATVAEIQPTMQSVVDHINNSWAGPCLLKPITSDMVKVEKYGVIDTRIGWDTYIVTVDGHGVFGMTDGPIQA